MRAGSRNGDGIGVVETRGVGDYSLSLFIVYNIHQRGLSLIVRDTAVHIQAILDTIAVLLISVSASW